jgi:hypothetical protein
MRITVWTFLRALAPTFLLGVCSLAGRSDAQAFAVGGVVTAVNDTGSAAVTSGFHTWGGHVFGEMTLERHVVLQLRGSRFTVSGSGTGAPHIRINAATVNVSYLFSEDWFHAGLFGGFGGYFLRPVTPGSGEEVIDRNETSFGWTGGLVTIFDLGARCDVRLEATGHLIRSSAQRKPIEIGIGVAYHF